MIDFLIHFLYQAAEIMHPQSCNEPLHHSSMLSDTTETVMTAHTVHSTFSDVVSQEGVVDFGALSVFAHLKPSEGDPPARPS